MSKSLLSRSPIITLGCCVWGLVNQKKSLPVKVTLLMASGWGADIYFNQGNRTLFLVKCRPELLSPASDWNCGGLNRGLRDPPVYLRLLQSKVCNSCAMTHPLALLRWQDVSGLMVWPHWGQADRSMWYGYVKHPAHEQPPSVLTAEVPGAGRVGMILLKKGLWPLSPTHESLQLSPCPCQLKWPAPCSQALPQNQPVARSLTQLVYKWPAAVMALSLSKLLRKRQNAFAFRAKVIILRFSVSSIDIQHDKFFSKGKSIGFCMRLTFSWFCEVLWQTLN